MKWSTLLLLFFSPPSSSTQILIRDASLPSSLLQNAPLFPPRLIGGCLNSREIAVRAAKNVLREAWIAAGETNQKRSRIKYFFSGPHFSSALFKE